MMTNPGAKPAHSCTDADAGSAEIQTQRTQAKTFAEEKAHKSPVPNFVPPLYWK